MNAPVKARTLHNRMSPTVSFAISGFAINMQNQGCQISRNGQMFAAFHVLPNLEYYTIRSANSKVDIQTWLTCERNLPHSESKKTNEKRY